MPVGFDFNNGIVVCSLCFSFQQVVVSSSNIISSISLAICFCIACHLRFQASELYKQRRTF